MPGASLSRWTMAYFAVACAFLLIAEVLLTTGYGYPAGTIEAPPTLAVVHLLTVGWFGLLMSGALLQFVPVLVAQPLRWGTLALPALVAIVLGDISLVGGFAALGNGAVVAGPLLSLGGLVLTTGYLAIAGIVGRTLAGARPLALPARFVALSLAALVATLGLGTLFALALSGYLPPAVSAFLPDGLPLHAALGLGGWLTVSAVGVSYRLLPMFLLAPDSAGRRAAPVWRAAGCAILLLFIAVFLVAADLPGVTWVLAAVLAASLVGLVLYGADLVTIYRVRRRPRLELNSLAGLAAFLALFLGAFWLAVAATSGRLASDIGAIVYLLGFGWLTGLGLAKLYKIIPFLTWLECYGPVLGRRPTPRVQDLVSETRARIWFLLFHLAVFGAAAALALDQASIFRAAAGVQLAMSLALVGEFLRARRLAEIAPDKRLPDGAIRPNLFLPSLHPTRST
ncbi:MAG: hypothetical protein ACK4PN_02295 [Allorhizobium sp.]